MGRKIKTKILQHKYFFYLMSFLAIANVIQFCYMGEFLSVILFIATGLISSLFLNNNTVIILISICIANIFSSFTSKEGYGKRGKNKINKAKDNAGEVADNAGGGGGGDEGGGDDGGGGGGGDEAAEINAEKRAEAADIRAEKRAEAAEMRANEREAAQREAAQREAASSSSGGTNQDGGNNDISIPFV